MFNQLGVIGCGLMGGSFALALKRAGLVKRVIGYSKSPSTTERAKKLGVIDDTAESALLAVSAIVVHFLGQSNPELNATGGLRNILWFATFVVAFLTYFTARGGRRR